MEALLALFVLVAGGVLLLGYRRYVERRDAALTASAGDGWRVRSHLPLNPGPPYSHFGADLTLRMPSDIMEGTDEGFEVAYFTVEANHRQPAGRVQRPASIVQLPFHVPTFTYDGSGVHGGPAVAEALRTPSGDHGGLGPRTVEVLSLARDVVVVSAGSALWIRSTGARPDTVSRLTMQLARALAADAEAVAPAGGASA